MSESWTILKLLQWTAEYLKSKGLESPRLEAEVLLAHLLNFKRIDLYVQFERLLTPTELSSFKTILKRRIENEPLAYIVGKKEFYGREFLVTPDVLIPRPETEMLVEAVKREASYVKREDPDSGASRFIRLRPSTSADRQLHEQRFVGFEIGLGSGCISISLLCEIPTLAMDAVEISDKAIVVAKQNAEKHNVLNRLRIKQNDILSVDRHVPRQDLGTRDDSIQQYDFIVSNPPYVSTAEMNRLPETVKKFEPKGALEAGDDGLLFYPKVAEFAKKHLKKNGFLMVEIGEDQGYRVAAIFKEHGFTEVEIKKDLRGIERVVIAHKKSEA